MNIELITGYKLERFLRTIGLLSAPLYLITGGLAVNLIITWLISIIFFGISSNNKYNEITLASVITAVIFWIISISILIFYYFYIKSLIKNDEELKFTGYFVLFVIYLFSFVLFFSFGWIILVNFSH